MSVQMKIADAMNTYNPALQVLKDQGYEIWVEAGESDDDEDLWCARKESSELVAFDPLRLLALSAILESRGGNWGKKSDEKDLYDLIMEEAYKD